ncbi:4Fe-4S dicluster domain-containing protein [Egibacter rhizosphaerae]|uniref:Glycolate oxidase iron-sulfur subunit n=1 Tax=Egibacter rhizosphaerae TaxID=1670831 RepID=A0A411YJH0_9ACTN|nr:heterodisulfide reductase-related iron-sulfur binding cluster [Egibacter rhizosphaerae]QBI21373.1 4Fe-4S dicluster domain-containing protein [Egibacter rhizosphaerae]
MSTTPSDRPAPGTAADTPRIADPHGGTGAFDGLRPPSSERLSECVHCGFCLPACPTYELWGQEPDSPRGRIDLMAMARRGEVALDETVVSHFDACLGCMACVTACPSGVQYGELIEATRAQVERHHRRPLPERAFRRLIFAVFPEPTRLRAALVGGWLYRRSGLRWLLRRVGLLDRLPSRLRTLEALVPEVGLRQLARPQRLPDRIPPAGPARRRVALLTGCVQSVAFAEVNAATARVLAADGCELVVPSDQGCCGALELHSGEEPRAIARAKRLVASLEAARADVIVTNAAGCGSTLKEYGHLLRDEPDWAERAARLAATVRDVSELLAELGPRAERHPVPARVVYQDACHLAHAQGVRGAPREVLRTVPGVDLVEIAEPELCCGSAGVYNLLQPEPAAELGRRKAAHIADRAPDLVVTANPGCALQVGRFLDVPVRHPVQLVDASIRGERVP